MSFAPRSLRVARCGVVLSLAAGAVVAAAVAPAAATPVAAPDVPVAAPAAGGALVNPANRASVRQGYQRVWAPGLAVPSGWTGSVAGCQAGRNPAGAQSATLRAVNFARELAGRTDVTMDPALSAKALQGALMQDANNALSHTPPSTWACYTAAGADGSHNSDLILYPSGITPGVAVANYLDDPGSANTAAAHRRWILYSQQNKIGSGTTNRANALYVVDPGSWLPSPTGSAVAAWPSSGYFPAQMEPDGKWSVSIPGADFTNAVVTVKHGTTSLATTVLSRGLDGFYGDPSLVWQVDPRYDISQGDQAFTVVVRGYKIGGVSKATSYRTTLFDATVGMPNRNVIAFPWPAAQRVGTTFDPGATNNNGLPVYYQSNTPDVCRGNFNPPSVTTLAAGTCSILAFMQHDDRYPDAPYETRTFTVTP